MNNYCAGLSAFKHRSLAGGLKDALIIWRFALSVLFVCENHERISQAIACSIGNGSGCAIDEPGSKLRYGVC